MRDLGFGCRWKGLDVLGFMGSSLGRWDEDIGLDWIGLVGLCLFALGADRSSVPLADISKWSPLRARRARTPPRVRIRPS